MADQSVADSMRNVLIHYFRLDQARVAELADASTGPLEDEALRLKLIDEKQHRKAREQRAALERAPRMERFELLAKLGEGGMGAVYKAYDRIMDRTVALKVMPEHIAKNQAFVDRFHREARSAVRLKHVNVVAGFDAGIDDGTHYFPMEFVDGMTVKDLVEKYGKLSVADATKIARDVALALHHAAEFKMVHRDIKPDNIMVTHGGVVKLADLGLAKQMDDDNNMTATGSGFGTPYYMPPEQAKNAKYVDARSDIYALGVTLYNVLTNEKPFDGETAMEVLLAKEKGQYREARIINKDIPTKLSLVIDKMMARDPDHRYQSAAELVAEFDKLGFHAEILSFAKGAKPAATSPESPSAAPTANTASQSPSANISPAASKPSAGRPEERTDTWYLRYKDSAGKEIKTKMPISRVVHMIKAKQLNAQVEAATNPQGPFRRLGAYREFEPLLRQDIQQQRVDKKAAPIANKMSALISNIDKEQAAHKRKQAISHGMFVVWSLIVTVAVLGGVGWALWEFVIKDQTKQLSVEAKKTDEEIKRNKELGGR